MTARNVGIFVDVASVSRNGGYGMRCDILRTFATRDGAEPVRLNAYVAFDSERATTEPAYRASQENYYALLRDFGYKVIQKPIRPYYDENGTRALRAGTEIEIAVDLLTQTDDLDRVTLVTGEGDFARAVHALQSRGTRVEVIGFENVSASLRREADAFYSGYLIPALLPAIGGKDPGATWGEPGSRVRGVCYNHHEKGYGFLRFLRRISPDLWKIDSRADDSPYTTAFFHDSHLPPEINPADLPNRQYIFEFELAVDDTKNRGLVARNIILASPRRRPVVRLADDAVTAVLSPIPATASPANDSAPADWKPGD